LEKKKERPSDLPILGLGFLGGIAAAGWALGAVTARAGVMGTQQV